MFKLESYITPILLSYVDKYIKNFRPEDSQVYLWGGDASFHNLDLRLDVLEDELQLPFNLLSGHIHELLIHVPWTKLASEPINITINTIECVLKLRGSETVNSEANASRENRRKQNHNRKQEMVAPPGYVQSLINKIVNNITINCNNLILKYVEEDIVVSVNIKLLTFQSANEEWKPAYTELSPSQMTMRKLITFSDLTVCLDKRNAAGKIEVYQEPVLYRCFIEMRFLRNFQASSSKSAPNTRLDIHCNKMEFSMTEQQVPMLLRMIYLLVALHQRQLKNDDTSDVSYYGPMEDDESSDVRESWTGWAWNFAASIFPSDDDANLDWDTTQQHTYLGPTLHIGVYVDHAILTFKVSEYCSGDRGYYPTRKLKYWPLLRLQLNGCYVDTVVGGAEWCSVQMGIAEAHLLPQGCCSCGIQDVPVPAPVPIPIPQPQIQPDRDELLRSATTPPPQPLAQQQPQPTVPSAYYLKTGAFSAGNHIRDSLFDAERDEANSQRKNFSISWEYYLGTITEDVLLEKTPAFALDYLYHLELPEDFTSDKLSELGSDLEYSNLSERSICRIVMGPLIVRVNSGLIHRMSTLQQVVNTYDYAPYKAEPAEPSLAELHPPSEDDFDALSTLIPTRVYQVTLLKPAVHFHLLDHPKFVPAKGNLFRRNKKLASVPPAAEEPSVSVECETLDIKTITPVYPKRLVYTTCQLPEPPETMFDACYKRTSVKVTGLSSHTHTTHKRTTILLPFSVSFNSRSIIFPQYWINPDVIHEEFHLDVDSITLTGTKAKLMVILYIMERYQYLEADYRSQVLTSSLFQDASEDSGMAVLELYGEHLTVKSGITASTVAYNVNLSSLKAFVLKEPNQVLIISGPESSDCDSLSPSNESDPILLSATVQYPKDPEKRIHASALLLNLCEIKMCVDPLLFQWLLYQPKRFSLKHDIFWSTGDLLNARSRTISEANVQETATVTATATATPTPRRAHTPHESIHSSSEREPNAPATSPPPRPHNIEHTPHEHTSEPANYETMIHWYPVWTNMILMCDIAHCTIYFPTRSLSAVGSQGVQDAIDMALTHHDTPPEIMVVALPTGSVRSAGQRTTNTNATMSHHSTTLPLRLPEHLWISNKESFPWTFSVKNFHCYTLQNQSKYYFLKPVSGNATIGLSVKYKGQDASADACKTPTTATTVSTTRDKQMKKPKPLKPKSKSADTVPSSPISNINSLSVCVHIDNSPFVVAVSKTQMCLISSILNALVEVTEKLQVYNCRPNSDGSKGKDDVLSNTIFRRSHSRSQSPTFYKEDYVDAFSERTPTSPRPEIKNVEENSNEVKCTIWVQWTIARLRVKLYAHEVDYLKSMKQQQQPQQSFVQPTLKLVLDMEDIMSSFDVQQVYTKFKSKIVTASINHYKRKSPEGTWQTGPYLGIVLRGREELPTTERQDDFGFISITITKAKCGHVHHKWGASKKHRLAEIKLDQHHLSDGAGAGASSANAHRYISEVVATLQPIDLIISPVVLRDFYAVLEPLLRISSAETNPPALVTELPTPTLERQPVRGGAPSQFTSANLPLAYLDCCGLKIFLVAAEGEGRHHDVCIVEVEGVSLVPTAENPICRTPVRPEIYQYAAQARILHVPGSEIEDRQYQLCVNALSVNTGSWSEFRELLRRDAGMVVVSSLHTMSENPALEWNNLEGRRANFTPHLSVLPIVKKFNQCLVIAPAIVYRNNILVCGYSMEVNFVTDIQINISLHQVCLITGLITDFMSFSQLDDSQSCDPKTTNFTYFDQTHLQMYNHEIATIDTTQYSSDYTRDSGVEVTDNTNSEFTLKTKETLSGPTSTETDRRNILKLHLGSKSSDLSQYMKSTNLVQYQSTLDDWPAEFLFTGGQMTVALYQITNKKPTDERDKKHYSGHRDNNEKDDAGYDASEEESLDGSTTPVQKVQPLLFLQLSQPNVFISHVALEKKINLSCFDIDLKANESQHMYIAGLPTAKDYHISLLEAKSGVPNPDTGIPPAFLSLKWVKGLGKPAVLDIDFGRPIKLFYSLNLLNHLLYIKDHILFNCTTPKPRPEDHQLLQLQSQPTQLLHLRKTETISYNKYHRLKTLLRDVTTFNLAFSQIVFVLKTEIGHELIFSIGQLESRLAFSTRPERISDFLTVKNVSLSTNVSGSMKLLLCPWSFELDSSAFWESWQSANSDPQLQLAVESGCVRFNIGPEQVKCLETVVEEFRALVERFQGAEVQGQRVNGQEDDDGEEELSVERDQYYKDDLRAGAFQFVDSVGSEEFPLPYQVVFWKHPVAAMAWRYPQPRILTKVRVFPVPFQLGQSSKEVSCFLEYWSDCHSCYKPYSHFLLSETELTHLDLPHSVPDPAISCTWRVRLSRNSDHCLSIKALAACLRVDSYFNPSLVPNHQLVLRLSSFSACFYNQFNKNAPLTMPEALKGFTPDGLVPDNQCFAAVEVGQCRVFGAAWRCGTALLEVQAQLGCSVLDYASLSLRHLLGPFSVGVTGRLAGSVMVDAVAEGVKLKFSPATAHTLAVASQVWTQDWSAPDLVIVTRYVICNDTNIKLRFGQVGTDEDILLPSRFLHMYCWRSRKHRRLIRVCAEQDGWTWSKPFDIDRDSSHTLLLGLPSSNQSKTSNQSKASNQSNGQSTLLVTIKSLSSTQKQIIFSGQLVISNMLLDHFELKVIPHNLENKEGEMKSTQTHLIGGKSTAPSLVVNLNRKLTLRLKFLNLESAWSGDIPLEENTRCSQPWLVKVPLQERGQFLSIWCRIVVQKSDTVPKILVMLWPLFMVRSNLPFDTRVHVETPALNVRIETTIRGRGDLQQLYCPGTIDHSHHLAFHLGSEETDSNPYVPLNYSLVDHKEIFRRLDKQDVNEILDFLKNYDESKWPYVNSTLNATDWITENQPLTHIQVRYQNVCEFSSSLLVELLPWCLILNNLGLPVAFLVNGVELCRLGQNAVITPPKLENTFNVAVLLKDSWNISPLLQLARPDWSQSFYMPKINGVIPLNGNIIIPVKCGPLICMMSVTSSILNEIRILQIASSHIVTNYTKFTLRVFCVALPDNNNNKKCRFSQTLSQHFYTVQSHLQQKNVGISVTHWYLADETPDAFSDYTLHIIISLDSDGEKTARSAPVRITKKSLRKNICLYSSSENIPLVLITQEYKNQMYLSIHHDIHPQLLIKNRCGVNIICAQCNTTNESPVLENLNIDWLCNIQADTDSYYTMPSVSEHFPNIEENSAERLILAAKFEESTRYVQWSQPININILNEQYVRIPDYGDVKLSIKQISHTVVIIIDSVTEVEISAQDIRSRLLLQSKKSDSSTYFDSSESLTKITLHQSPENSAHASKTDLNDPSLNSSTVELSDPTELLQQFSTSSSTTSNTGALERRNRDRNRSSDVTDLKLRATYMKTLLKEYCPPNKQENNTFNLALLIKSVVFTLMVDVYADSDADGHVHSDTGFEHVDFTTLTLDCVTVTFEQNQKINWSLNVGDIQCDNQFFSRGSYDFPVVLISENSAPFHQSVNFQNMSIRKIIEETKNCAVITVDLQIEMWDDEITATRITEIQEVRLKVGPLLAYIEDTYVTNLLEHLSVLYPTQVVLWPRATSKTSSVNTGSTIRVPDHLCWEAAVLARPLQLRLLILEPASLLLSVHSSVKLYIALDRSPLQFARFERRGLRTTAYRLGHALTMHYLSGAIFGAGWVVGSLELLGSPSGLARTLGSGLRDFISLPYHGLVQGPWAFLVGVTHGSASLMRHVTAGTLDSVTKLAASVARNLDRLTLDEEHQRRTEEMRRQKPRGLAQGFVQGLTGLGISLLGAVGGIAHHPLQAVVNERATPRGLVAGVGLGLVGVITKPLSGAAELVALTGQGLLQGAGWNPLPAPRPSTTAPYYRGCAIISDLRYKWKLLQQVMLHGDLVAVVDAIYNGQNVTLAATADVLVVINTDEDAIQKVIPFAEISNLDCGPDTSTTTLYVTLAQPTLRPTAQQNAEPRDVEMDPVCRARVADYIRNASGLLQMSPLGSASATASGSNSDAEAETGENAHSLQRHSLQAHSLQPRLAFTLHSQSIRYVCDIFTLIKQQNQNSTFRVL